MLVGNDDGSVVIVAPMAGLGGSDGGGELSGAFGASLKLFSERALLTLIIVWCAISRNPVV